MFQINKKKKLEQESPSLSNLKKQFEEILATPSTRIVRLIARSCCGCGCNDINIEREVPFDSDLKNGDYVKKVERTDKIV